MNAVILPDGTVLAMGGSVNDEDLSTKSLNADLYDPASNTFSSAGANAYARLYHSVALLLPDATVWLAGGNPSRGSYESHVEVYQPAYLFQSNGSLATRPTIGSAPGNIGYGNSFTVQTPDAANISSAVLIRAAASTHAFGMDQRMVGMSFTAGSGSLTVTAPPNGNIAPPGYYMLFILNSAGVPSVSTFVLLNDSAPPPPPAPAPTVTSISPSSGTTSGGVGVAIKGTGFQSGATVKLGGTAATGVTVVSSTSITATTPAHSAGAVSVVVTNTDGQSGTLSGGFTYASASGTGGIGFVQVASGPGTVQPSASAVVVPYSSPQTAGDLNVVAVGWGDSTSSVSSVSDSGGNSYTRAVGPTANGTLQQSIYYARNIAAGSNTVTVTFNQAAKLPDVRILEYSGLDKVVPLDVTAAATGSGTSASSGSATTTSANELIFGAGSTSGAYIGAGTGFTSRIINNFGNIAEDEVVSSTGSYNAAAPNSSSKWVMQMAAFRQSGQVASNPAPTVSAISPATGTAAGGTAVTITGTGFVAGATVSIGGAAATGVTVSSSTSIKATTAAHATGAVNVVVTNSDTQSGTLTQGFTYTAVPNPAPTVAAISPTSGTNAGGTAVTITGTGFLTRGTVSLGGTAATGVTVASSTSITATAPAHAAGAVSVVVTNTDGQKGTLANGYTYVAPNPAPTAVSIAPNSGPTAGGTSVTIKGTGFLPGATVSLGGTGATGVTLASSTSITAITPAHAAGAVNVVVTNTDGQKGTLANGYTYSATPSNLGLGVLGGDSSSATVTAGQTASYTLSIGGDGMGGTASLSCAGAPTAANCSVPASQPFNSTTPATFNVTVTTTARTAGALVVPGSVGSNFAFASFAPVAWLSVFAILGIVVLPGVGASKKQSGQRYLRLLPLTLALFLVSCGGGAGSGSTASPQPQPSSSGTPAGNYTLSVMATSGATTQTTTLTLIVK